MVTFGQGFPGLATVGLPGDREAVSSGWPALDGLLPGGGVRRGSLIEWLAGEADAACGSGAATLACAVACRLAASRDDARGGLIVVVDRAGWFHPPAVLPWLGGARLVVARPSRDDDEMWAIEQSLRCAGVAAVVAWPRLAAAWSLERGVAAERRSAGRGGLQQWTTIMRRWQLAARSAGAVGLFVRSPQASCEPSWAESRLAVSAAPGGSLVERRLRVARVGGVWCRAEADAGRPIEIVLDMARGRAAPDVSSPMSRRQGIARPHVAPEIVPQGGASCRAS
jgi:hypothetical protein